MRPDAYEELPRLYKPINLPMPDRLPTRFESLFPNAVKALCPRFKTNPDQSKFYAWYYARADIRSLALINRLLQQHSFQPPSGDLHHELISYVAQFYDEPAVLEMVEDLLKKAKRCYKDSGEVRELFQVMMPDTVDTDYLEAQFLVHVKSEILPQLLVLRDYVLHLIG